jgi:Lar family restriction alleviation protein
MDLKPCPFCGGRATLEGRGYYWGECNSCGAMTRGSEDKQKAIEEWNRRAEDADQKKAQR